MNNKNQSEIAHIALPIALEVVAVSLFIAMIFVWVCVIGTGGV